jgi:hypothetical protein
MRSGSPVGVLRKLRGNARRCGLKPIAVGGNLRRRGLLAAALRNTPTG